MPAAVSDREWSKHLHAVLVTRPHQLGDVGLRGWRQFASQGRFACLDRELFESGRHGEGQRPETIRVGLDGVFEAARSGETAAMCAGVESMLVLEDICGLNHLDAEETKTWAAAALLKVALDEAHESARGPRAGIPPRPSGTLEGS